jgi:15-cis-phytoene synthase
MDDELAASYRYCKQICRDSQSSFCWTFRLLGPQPCAAMQALYAFARISDDISDQSTPLNDRRSQLLAWRQQVEALVSASSDNENIPSSHTSIAHTSIAHTSIAHTSIAQYDGLWPALRHTIEQFNIPVHYLRLIVDGVMMDLDHRTPADWSELENYCYHVASAVGLACTCIWRAQPTMPIQAAVDCGYAFQLTNILRDIRRDAKLGRIYLPASELSRFSVDANAWLAGRTSGDWEGLIASVAKRADSYYASSWQTIEYLPASSRRMFSLMWRYYRALLSEVIRQAEFLPSDHYVRIPVTTKVRLAAQHFISPWYRLLPSPVRKPQPSGI